MQRVGQRGYLLLSSSFGEPRWREALIIGLQKEWAQTLVRASPEKIDRLKLSSCQLGEHHYCVVECTKQPTQTGCTGAQAGAGVQCQGVGAQGQRIARLRHRAIRGVILVKPECDFVKISQ